MSKLTKKIAVPIILAGLFAIIVFVSIGYDKLEPSFYIIVLFLVIYVFFFGLATGQNLSSPVKKFLPFPAIIISFYYFYPAFIGCLLFLL